MAIGTALGAGLGALLTPTEEYDFKADTFKPISKKELKGDRIGDAIAGGVVGAYAGWRVNRMRNAFKGMHTGAGPSSSWGGGYRAPRPAAVQDPISGLKSHGIDLSGVKTKREVDLMQRKARVKYHPDMNRGNERAAEEKFKQIDAHFTEFKKSHGFDKLAFAYYEAFCRP